LEPRGLLRTAVTTLDVVAIVLGLLTAHSAWIWWKPRLDSLLQISAWDLWLPNPFMPSGLVLVFCWLLILRQSGLYDPTKMTNSPRLAAGVSRASMVLLVVVMMLQFLLPDRTYSRFLILSFCGFSSAYLLAFRLVFFQIQVRLPRPIASQRVAIVGVDPDAGRMARFLARHGHHTYELVGFIRTHEDPSELTNLGAPILGSLDDFPTLVNEHNLQVVVLASQRISRSEALPLATRADQMGLVVLQVPFSWGIASPRVVVANMGDLQLIDLTTLAYPTLAEQVKRVLDLVVVFVGGLLLLPLLVGVGVAIKLHDGGPIFFSQPRAGKGGRQFPFFKFRSMVVEAEAQRVELQAHNEADGVLFKMKDDPRITPVGRFIRKYSIDELPQIWNVLRGDMNLVGPRPLPMTDLVGIEENAEYRYWFEMRSKVCPGITGAWQVSGRSNLGFQEMVQHDVRYIQSWTIWLDLALLVKTVPAVLRGRGAR
jgi:exopolysaccharide biosynthesis polyprenyl glycosylphosphotransferase